MMAKRKRTNSKWSILLVDDHPIVRGGLRLLIDEEKDLRVMGEAGTAKEASALVRRAAPDLAVVDLVLPDRSGMELIRDLQMERPGLLVLVLSMHDEALYAERVLRAGARGYVMKTAMPAELLRAIRRVLAGHSYVSERMSETILRSLSTKHSDRVHSPIGRLTDREFGVFELIGQGRGTRQIAEQLHVSMKTVEVHRLHIKQKLELQTASELVHFAVRWVETQADRSVE